MQNHFFLRQLNKVLLFSFLFYLLNCGGTKKIITVSVDEYNLEDPQKIESTISNVTINVEPLSPSKTYNFPELFTFDYDQLPSAMRTMNVDLNFPADLNGKRWCYTFGAGRFLLTAFKIKITNNTPHILRMKDARIYLIVEGEDPIAAVTKVGNPQLYTVGEKANKKVLPKSAIDGDESLIHWVTYFEEMYEKERPKGFLSLAYPIGIASQVISQNMKSYKLINDVSKEILPGFSYSGILLFPYIVSKPKVKLAFYDITTKTDAAGNPIEKAKFEFPLKLETVNMWFDDLQKKWKIGNPPVSSSTK